MYRTGKLSQALLPADTAKASVHNVTLRQLPVYLPQATPPPV